MLLISQSGNLRTESPSKMKMAGSACHINDVTKYFELTLQVCPVQARQAPIVQQDKESANLDTFEANQRGHITALALSRGVIFCNVNRG